jgi:hypothetical protein
MSLSEWADARDKTLARGESHAICTADSAADTDPEPIKASTFSTAYYDWFLGYPLASAMLPGLAPQCVRVANPCIPQCTCRSHLNLLVPVYLYSWGKSLHNMPVD